MQFRRIRRKVHTSWFAAMASIGVVIGAAVVPSIDQSLFGPLIWLGVGIILMVIVLSRRFVYLLPLALAAGMIIGLWRGSVLQSQLTVYSKLMKHTIVLAGSVSDDPDVGKNGATLLRLKDIRIDSHEVAGKIWVSTVGSARQVKRGDTVTLKGKLSDGFGSFSASMTSAKVLSIKRPQPGDVAGQVRDWFASKTRLAIKEPEVSLGLGYLVGQRRALPPELSQALVIAGLTHVVVASGYNLTILVRLARRLFVRISKYLATLSASVMILAFIGVTGISPSMTRAGLVSGLSLAAWYYGRKFHPFVLLPFAAALTVLIDPTYAWNDLGWQLSFTAFAGVMILAPLLQSYFFGSKKPGTVRQILGETISATIVTLPILMFAFGQFSNVALPANLMVLPLVPFAMLLTFAAGIGAIVTPPLAPIIGLPAQWLLGYMTWVVQYFAALPWAMTIVEVQVWMVWVAYVLIIAACLYMWRATKYDFRSSSIIE